jgi:hypothetical protein
MHMGHLNTTPAANVITGTNGAPMVPAGAGPLPGDRDAAGVTALSGFAHVHLAPPAAGAPLAR